MQDAEHILMKNLGKLISKYRRNEGLTVSVIRTDMAVEAFENVEGGSVEGVRVSRWETDGVEITEVLITDNEAAQLLGKPRGSYLTLECPLLLERDPDARLAVASILSEEIGRLLPEREAGAPVLVVGLGNRDITPDSLGPGVVDRTLVTRHIQGAPFAAGNMDSVCAVAPGVLGVTGIESMELVEAVSRAVRPRVILCVDSLAARDSHRIGCSIQLTDTGIQPGAGVGNHRRPLTRESVGAPVISLGMPTVIYAATLARDAFAWLARREGDAEDHEEALADMEKALLGDAIGEMIVTPRDIDAIVQDAVGIIASGINRALHPNLSDAEISAMME
uniref:Putative spore protease n=1 Tax=uncultured bacterium Ad_125_D08 TaxID=1489285 RepID=A0A0B4N150_9BACT|nr:putative spore protease [uncultured bacterium Ad_125_D08]